MSNRLMRAALTVAAVLALALPVAAQSKAAKPPRTPDGKPSLEGTFNFATITPLQRPQQLAGKTVLTDEERAAFEQAENTRQNRDLFDPEKGQPSAGYPGRADGGVLSYNEFWYERGNKMTADKRTSLITEPADGRIPMTPEVAKKSAQNGRDMYLGLANDYEDRTLADRCLMGFNAGPPMHPGAYNNNLQIVQTPKYLVIMTEMVHTARIIPINGGPHGTLRKWNGDSRARWEGETLVVETLNFHAGTSLPASSSSTKVVERFTRVDANTINYEFTVTDPTTLTSPWSAKFPLNAIDEPLYEYACHEGNYSLRNILGAARRSER